MDEVEFKYNVVDGKSYAIYPEIKFKVEEKKMIDLLQITKDAEVAYEIERTEKERVASDFVIELLIREAEKRKYFMKMKIKAQPCYSISGVDSVIFEDIDELKGFLRRLQSRVKFEYSIDVVLGEIIIKWGR